MKSGKSEERSHVYFVCVRRTRINLNYCVVKKSAPAKSSRMCTSPVFAPPFSRYRRFGHTACVQRSSCRATSGRAQQISTLPSREAQAAPGRNLRNRQLLRIRTYGKPLCGKTTSLEHRKLQRIPVGFGSSDSMAHPNRCARTSPSVRARQLPQAHGLPEHHA